VRRLSWVLVALVILLVSAPAHAELLRITPLGFSPAGYLGQTDPVLIGSEGFRLTYHSQGDGNYPWVNPVELILGIPGGLVAPLLTVITSPGLTVDLDLGGTSTMYGGSWDTTTGFAGTFTGSPISKVYDFIGFEPKGSASQNFSNWGGYSGLNSWNLFVYALSFSPRMTPNQYVEFSAAPDLPEGTFVIGYGQEEVKKGTCGNPSCAQSTPFTFAGYVPEQTQQVPEPASSVLLTSGLGLLLVKIRRRRRT
jgi:PEP-CTERM motif